MRGWVEKSSEEDEIHNPSFRNRKKNFKKKGNGGQLILLDINTYSTLCHSEKQEPT